jgi:FlaG/FlaF family flagellin (archaellin)
MERDRALGAVAATALLLAIVVISTGVIGGLLMTQDSDGRAPVVAPDHDGTIPADSARPGDQTLTLAHGGGPALDVRELDLIVRVPEYDRETRLTGLPIGRDGLDSDEYRGDDLLDRRDERFSGPIVTGGNWSVGERIRLRLKHGGDGVHLDPGDEVRVVVVERESETVVMEAAYRAVE